MLHHHFFTTTQILLFYSSIVLFILSLIEFYKKKDNCAILLLFSGSLVFGVFMGILDPYLCYWDEQFHALVAKNLMEYPFKPMLFKNPVLEYSHQSWVSNHIWLHKQPLFLWQMALSMKIFGITPFAVRFPSILMHALMVFLIYRIGHNLINKRVGFYGAFLFAMSNFMIELMVGWKSTDHNDMAFVFYTTASLWAWTEFSCTIKTKWLIFIGLLSGCAVLNKWLPGLLVYGAWGIAILLNKEERLKLKSYLQLLFSFAITVVVFLPWQIYTFIQFPIESKFESELNVLHFTQPIEGHIGNWSFHFNQINTLYGEGDLVPWVILFGFLLLIFYAKEHKYRIFMFTAAVLVYSFYSFAATKMGSFTLIICVFAFLSLGIVFDKVEDLLTKITNKIRISSIITLLILSFFGFLSLNLMEIEKTHTLINNGNNPTKNLKEKELKVFDYLVKQEPDTSFTFFNLPYYSYVPFMFYKNYHAAYDYFPSEIQLKKLKEKKIKFIVVDNNQNNIPEYITSDPTIRIIKNPFW